MFFCSIKIFKKKVHLIGFNGCDEKGKTIFKSIPYKIRRVDFENDFELAFLFRKGRFSYPWLYIIKRRFYKKNKIVFAEGLFFEDHLFNVELLYYCRKVRIIPFALYNHRLHHNSITGNFSIKKLMDLYKVYEKLEIFLIEKKIFRMYQDLYFARYLTHCVYRSFQIYHGLSRADKNDKIKSFLEKIRNSNLLNDSNLNYLKKVVNSIPPNEIIRNDYYQAYQNLKIIKKNYGFFKFINIVKNIIRKQLKERNHRF